MKTTALGIENLCVPCHAHCRYCLLSSCGKAEGVDYARGKKFAERLLNEAERLQTEYHVYYYIGYCMDDENLLDYIRFSQKYNAPSARFLQLNGLRFRSEQETEELICAISKAGVETIDLTFYGTKDYHDRFAGRPGDFDFLTCILRSAVKCGLNIHASCPLHKENIDQAERLLELLTGYCGENISFFLPHGKGRGHTLDSLRLTLEDQELLSESIKNHLGICRTEQEWITGFCGHEPQSRVLTLVLRPDNIDLLEQMTLAEIVKYLETMDDQYYAALPSTVGLLEQYGNKSGTRLYRRFRDLHLEWQQKYLAESGRNVWDMNDETHHFSIRT